MSEETSPNQRCVIVRRYALAGSIIGKSMHAVFSFPFSELEDCGIGGCQASVRSSMYGAKTKHIATAVLVSSHVWISIRIQLNTQTVDIAPPSHLRSVEDSLP